MTDANKTHIAVILDRSGSMQSIKGDMLGGLLAFIADQLKQPGECTLDLFQFDEQYEVVFEGVPLRDVPPIVLTPRGSTALLDATFKSITRIGERLGKLPEADRPAAVIVIIITDGFENASREVSRQQVKSAIERQTNQYRWQFVYLGADPTTFAEAASLGISAQSSSKYQANSVGVSAVYVQASAAAKVYRAAVRSAGGASSDISFSMTPEAKPVQPVADGTDEPEQQ